MKAVSLFFSFFLVTTTLYAENIPTPAMAVSFDIKQASREWVQSTMDGNAKGFVAEFIPKGDSIKSWNELVAQQIFFTGQSLTEYVKLWKSGLVKVDPNAQFKERKNKDGSITIDYTSLKENEAGIRRFMKASDGIYMITYQVRPKLKDDKVYQLWTTIIDNASLARNPYK
jgi:ADP-glucose pyrophosphorylase